MGAGAGTAVPVMNQDEFRAGCRLSGKLVWWGQVCRCRVKGSCMLGVQFVISGQGIGAGSSDQCKRRAGTSWREFRSSRPAMERPRLTPRRRPARGRLEVETERSSGGASWKKHVEQSTKLSQKGENNSTTRKTSECAHLGKPASGRERACDSQWHVRQL